MSTSSPDTLVYTNAGFMDLDDYPRPKVTFLPPANSSITIMGGAPLYPSRILLETLLMEACDLSQ